MKLTGNMIGNIARRLKKLNFSNDQIRKIFISMRKIFSRIDFLEENYEYYHEKMLAMGYTEYQLHELAAIFPTIIYNPLTEGKFSSVYRRCIDSLPKEEVNTLESEDMLEVLDLLISLGIREKRICALLIDKTSVCSMKKKKVLDNMAFYKTLGLTDEDIMYLENQNGRFLEFGADYYKDILDKLKLFGINSFVFGTMLLRAARMKFVIEKERILPMLDWALSKNLVYEKFGESFAKTVSITASSVDNLESGFQNILKLGFTDDEACYLVSIAASTLSMSYDNLKKKFDVPRKLSISEQDVKKIIIGYPAYFTLSAENLKEKFCIYKKYNLVDYVVCKPKNIQQSADLTAARAVYLKQYFPWITDVVFSRMVFTSEEVFKKRFNGNNAFVKSLCLNLGGV